MDYMKKTLLNTAFVISIGFVPLLLCIQPHPAYGYKRADVERLLSERDCPQCNLSGANLKNANLQGINLKGANLKGADLSGVNLGSADLSNANLANTNVQEAQNLLDANFANAKGLTTWQTVEFYYKGALNVP